MIRRRKVCSLGSVPTTDASISLIPTFESQLYVFLISPLHDHLPDLQHIFKPGTRIHYVSSNFVPSNMNWGCRQGVEESVFQAIRHYTLIVENIKSLSSPEYVFFPFHFFSFCIIVTCLSCLDTNSVVCEHTVSSRCFMQT
jgi:hypothetical protein